MTMKERVLVAMSGGVDSSVAAALLVEQGYDVVGATMKLFCHGDDLPDRPCCSLDSVNDARRVCEQLGVPHYVLNLESAFGRDVVDNFVERVRARPHADSLRALQHVHEVSRSRSRRPTRSTRSGSRPATTRASSTASCIAASIATRIRRISSGESIAPCCSRMLLPVGAQTKAETRARRAPARPRGDRREAGEPGHLLRARRRSHEDHSPATRRRRAVAVARAHSCCRTARVVGKHDGFARYTIGQRRGLPGGFREPMFVVDDSARAIAPS